MRIKLLAAVGALIALGGCVAYPAGPGYYGHRHGYYAEPRGGYYNRPNYRSNYYYGGGGYRPYR